jgi:glycosyltransferase involved in cell wall biosynthesis
LTGSIAHFIPDWAIPLRISEPMVCRAQRPAQKRIIDRPRPDISVIIKAFNEERRIATAVESALAAVHGINAEVILADSASNDRTVEIAKQYPIKIVRLNKTEDRSCGAGAQLGYQYSAGRYICLIDGDMRLRDGFLQAAMRFFEHNPDAAAVTGTIIEYEKQNLEYVRRVTTEYVHNVPGLTNCLEGGGALYRRAAIESVVYFSDPNIHMWEDVELAVRLRARGWKLARLGIPFVDHQGHSGDAYRLLLRRWKTRYAFGIGEVLRGTLGQVHLTTLVRHWRRFLLLICAVHVWWLSLLAGPFILRGVPLAIFMSVLALLPFAVMSWRRRSVALGIYSVAAWNVYALGLWPGLFRHRVNPTDWIESTVVHDASENAIVAPSREASVGNG